MTEYPEVLRKLAALRPCIAGEDLDFVYEVIYDRFGHLRKRISDRQLAVLKKVCDRAEARRAVGFDRFNFGTAIDRLVNKGLCGVATQRGVTLQDIVEFRKRCFNEETGEIDSGLKGRVIESGMKAGRSPRYHSRFGICYRERSQKQREWIKEQYLKAFALFEEYLRHGSEFKEPG